MGGVAKRRFGYVIPGLCIFLRFVSDCALVALVLVVPVLVAALLLAGLVETGDAVVADGGYDISLFNVIVLRR